METLGYAFTWLTKYAEEENAMFGQIKLEHFTGLASMPQKAATAWAGAFTAGLVGAEYKPLLFYGTQEVHGKNYFFIAEQTLVTNPPIRRLVKLIINELDGEYKLIGVEEV